MTLRAHSANVSGRGAGASWMVTLADLLALLLTFFVLLFSMNAVQYEDWQSVIASFRDQFNPEAARALEDSEQAGERVRQFVPWGADLDYLAAVFRHKLDRPPLEDAALTKLGDRVVISLPAALLFVSGSDRPQAGAEETIAALAGDLGRLENAVRVSGHTDPAPVGGERYASNWELSLQRADAVAEMLKSAGYDQPLTVLGYGAGRFADLAPQRDGERRAALARRVDIAVLKTGGEDGDAR